MVYEKKKGNTIMAAFLIFAISVLTIIWFATADYRLYKRAEELYKNKEYTDAARIFEELSDYRDSSVMLLECRYEQAVYWQENENLADAASVFDNLGDYRDSIARMGKCYYSLATKARLDGNFEDAYALFESAGEYYDATTQAQRMLYSLGHEAFLHGDYKLAENWFSQMEGQQWDYGNPHFLKIEDAAVYLDQQLEDMNKQIQFHLGEVPEEGFYDKIFNMLHYHRGAPSYFENDKLVTIMVTEYYAADKILDAWQNQTTEFLSEEERQVLDLALELIKQASEETDSNLALEKWLHDWLCQKVVYESPDMDVKVRDYIQLRELNCIGAMLDGRANCQGYTDAFYLLGNLAGFEVRRLLGNAGGGHIWNMIRMEDQWYIVDVTFDDLAETSFDGWTYTYFNTAWDPEVYEIYGGPEVLPGIATQFNSQISHFNQDSIFSDVDNAADYLAECFYSQGSGWCYAMIDDAEVTREEMEKALKTSLRKKYVGYASWGMLMDSYNGDTYISICWK